MQIIIYLYFLLFLFISPIVQATEVDYTISKEYNKIFNKKILNEKDVVHYQNIFLYQKKCAFKKADSHILKITDAILMGHVLAQRYLHPKCYRSKFEELSSWLKKYNDHPQAKRIYRLAIKRMPKNYKSPKKPQPAIGIKIDLEGTKKLSNKYISKLQLNKNQRSKKYQLLTNIKSRVNQGWPTGALKLLNQSSSKKLLDSVEIDKQKELIAKGYFLANKNELAIKYANEALNRSPQYVPFANWTAGLSSWRVEEYGQAAYYFSNFAIALRDDKWHQSSGSFWAARSYGQINNYEEVNFWLNLSAQNFETFYGQISNKILGTTNTINWKSDILDNKSEKSFFKIPAGKRIMALIQIGRVNDAENEIIKLNKSINESVALISLVISKKFNFAKTQLKIANKLESLNKKVPVKYYYPVPSWKTSFDKVDKALVFAFIHQESSFNKDAKSRKGAIGLMQIMPKTAKFISTNKIVKRNNANILKDPLLNIEVGQEYIEYLLNLDYINNNLIFMTAAYNGGPGNLKKWLKETNYKNDPLLFMESIPSRETRWFIEKVITKFWIYKHQFNEESQSLLEIAKGDEPIYLKSIN